MEGRGRKIRSKSEGEKEGERENSNFPISIPSHQFHAAQILVLLRKRKILVLLRMRKILVLLRKVPRFENEITRRFVTQPGS